MHVIYETFSSARPYRENVMLCRYSDPSEAKLRDLLIAAGVTQNSSTPSVACCFARNAATFIYLKKKKPFNLRIVMWRAKHHSFVCRLFCHHLRVEWNCLPAQGGRRATVPHLLLRCFLLLRVLNQLPYIMREIGPNGFPLSIGGAADVLYIKLGPLWAHTDDVIFVTAVML